jgi:peroxiredoxin
MSFIQNPEPAPDFSLSDLDGTTHQLSDYHGQPALLVFLRHLG